jgi:hypothetical protein
MSVVVPVSTQETGLNRGISKRASQRRNIAKKATAEVTAKEGTVEHLEQSGAYHPVDDESHSLSKIAEDGPPADISPIEEQESEQKNIIHILIESEHSKHYRFVVHPYSKFRRAWDVGTVFWVLYLCWKIPVFFINIYLWF